METGRGTSNRPIAQRPEKTRSFIIRLWFERRDDAPPALRGTIAELGGDTIGAFGSIDELSAILVRELTV